MNICKLTLNCIAVHCGIWTTIINHTAVCTTRDYEMCSDASHLTLTNRCHMCAYNPALTNLNEFWFVFKLLSLIELCRKFHCISAKCEVTVQCCQKDYILVPQNCFVLGTGPRWTPAKIPLREPLPPVLAIWSRDHQPTPSIQIIGAICQVQLVALCLDFALTWLIIRSEPNYILS